MKFIIAMVLCFLLIGCGNRVHIEPEIDQQVLLQYCEYDTPELKNPVKNEKGELVYNGKEIMRVLVEWQSYYNKCASLHDELVDTLKDLQKAPKVPYKLG